MHQQVPCRPYSQKMIYLGLRHIACCKCKLAPTLARKMWRHNYVTNRNKYLIFTLSESVNPWVYSLQFLFKSTNNSWRWCFFLNTVYSVAIDLQELRHCYKTNFPTRQHVASSRRVLLSISEKTSDRHRRRRLGLDSWVYNRCRLGSSGSVQHRVTS